MKRIFATSVLFLALAVGAFAQSSTNLFKMTSVEDADLVLKVLTTDLHLDPAVHGQVRELLQKSAKSQAEQMMRMQSKDEQMESAIVTRQSLHIETNLKNIIGEDKYKQYEQLKDKLAADLSKLKH